MMKIDPPIHLILPQGEGYIVDLDEDLHEIVVEMADGRRIVMDSRFDADLIRRPKH